VVEVCRSGKISYKRSNQWGICRIVGNEPTQE
jgi:hypothetical protein